MSRLRRAEGDSERARALLGEMAAEVPRAKGVGEIPGAAYYLDLGRRPTLLYDLATRRWTIAGPTDYRLRQRLGENPVQEPWRSQLPRRTVDELDQAERRLADLRDAADAAYEAGDMDRAEELDAQAEELAERIESMAEAVDEVAVEEAHGERGEEEPRLREIGLGLEFGVGVEDQLAEYYRRLLRFEDGTEPFSGVESEAQLAELIRREWGARYPNIARASDAELVDLARDAYEALRGRILRYRERRWARMAGNASLPRTQEAFDRHFDVIERELPDFGTLELHIDPEAHDGGRHYAYCKAAGGTVLLAFAPEIEGLPPENIDGLVAHEMGHAVDFRYGKALEGTLGPLPSDVEERADEIARRLFGKTIEYDDRLVQCVGCGGQSPRPKGLR